MKSSSLTPNQKWKKELLLKVNHINVQFFMSILLLLSLFLPDSWILGNAPEYSDPVKSGILLAVLIIFMVEFVVLSVIQEGYLFSVFFWLDLIGNISIIIDIQWIANQFIPSSAATTSASVVRATRAARLGARYGRLLRLIRILRFIKQLPCLKRFDNQDYEPTMSAIKKVSDELSNVLSIRTAILIVFLIIIVPFLNYTPTDSSFNAWIINLKLAAKNESTTAYDLNNLLSKCQRFYSTRDNRLHKVYLESPFMETLQYKYRTRELLRSDNIITLQQDYYVNNSTLASSGNSYALSYLNNAASEGRNDRYGYVQFSLKLTFDATVPNELNALFNILLMVLVILCLFTFTESFNSSISKLVVRPLEKMMSTLRNSAMVMLKSLKSLDSANEEEEKKDNQKGEGDEDSEEDEELESAMLEKIVEKLTRIVKHVVPNNEIAIEGNIDKATANWLNQAYSAGHVMKDKNEIVRAESVIGDEAAEKLRQKNLEQLLAPALRSQLSTWDFDVLKHDTEELHNVVTYIFNNLNLLEEFKVPEKVFRNFVGEIAGRYINTNTYHNYKHGVDVCFTSYRLLTVPSLTLVFSALEVFSVLVGALAHDVGHPGLNNLYLVKSKHELAIMHNDKSPLENMHCVVLYEILAKENTNIFVNLSEKQWREARKVIITIVLGTDMSHHFEQINKTQVRNLFFQLQL